jgi:hypothetical protein
MYPLGEGVVSEYGEHKNKGATSCEDVAPLPQHCNRNCNRQTVIGCHSVRLDAKSVMRDSPLPSRLSSILSWLSRSGEIDLVGFCKPQVRGTIPLASPTEKYIVAEVHQQEIVSSPPIIMVSSLAGWYQRARDSRRPSHLPCGCSWARRPSSPTPQSAFLHSLSVLVPVPPDSTRDSPHPTSGTQWSFHARHSTRCFQFNVLRLPVARARFTRAAFNWNKASTRFSCA